MKQYLTLFILIFASLLNAKKGIELIRAEKTFGEKKGDIQFRIFEGNVHFRQDTVDMYCHKTLFLERENLLKFRGNVLIDNGKRKIKADSIDYNPNEKTAVCMGRVQIFGEGDSLYSDWLRYNFITEDAVCKGNLFLYRSIENTIIRGEYGVFQPQIEYARVDSNARLTRIGPKDGDTLSIIANSLIYEKKEEELAIAIDSVRIEQGALRCQCDTARYFREQEIIGLIGSPIAWIEESVLSSQRMKVALDSMDLRRIELYEEALTKNLSDSVTGEYNTLTAHQIFFDIENKKPEKITAISNASSIYYLESETGKQGSNFATADTITAFFQKGELDSIHIQGGSEGVWYPQEYKGKKIFEER
jgi:lipopolysaccharide export system protein LptA